MNASLQAYLQGPEPLSDGSHACLQRQALDEVLRLSAPAVQPLEAQIEADYRTARQRTQEQFTKDQGRLDAEWKARSEEMRHQYDTRLQALRADYETQLGALKIDAQHGHSRVSQKATELIAAAEKEYQDQIMVADFVAEGAATRIGQARVEAQSTFQEAHRHLDALATEAARLVELYRQSCPAAAEKSEPPTDAGPSPAEIYRAQQALAEQHLRTLGRLFVAQLFAGVRPLLFAGGVEGAAAVLVALVHSLHGFHQPPLTVTGPVVMGGGLVLLGVSGPALWRRARRQVRREFCAFQEALTQAGAALDRQHQLTLADLERQSRAALEQKEAELRKARETFETTKTQVAKQRGTSLQEIDERARQTLERLKQQRDAALAEAEHQYRAQQSALEQRHRQDQDAVQTKYDQEMAACESAYRTSRQALEQRWDRGLACIQALLQDTADLGPRTRAGWDDLLQESWVPPEVSPPAVRFGAFGLNLGLLADTVRARAAEGAAKAESMKGEKSKERGRKSFSLSHLLALSPSSLALPALLEFPQRCSMLVQTAREGRPQAIETLRAVMMRLFTSLPPGRIRFTILDPVGLGESFAGFMHAGDYQEALVGGRIWTETAQIQQQLEDLTQHIENVIQKYLRNEFETIEQYNQQAGELAEPYRFLVIADFPTNFNEESARRLSSIIHSGPRCGVHTLIAYDTRHDLPAGIDLADVSANSIHLLYEDGRFVWQDQVLRQFPLTLDGPPEETTLTKIMHVVGQAGARAARVEVPFEAVAPTPDQTWSLDSREEICVPLGRTGATRLQYFRLGRGVAQHLLIAGKTGSGKSTLLHVLVTNLALWYAPDQVELYLIDFKQGVEFKTYATHHLPHARAVAIESDREFGLSILRRLEAEMARRGEQFRSAGVQDINAYRQKLSTEQHGLKPILQLPAMPRTVLIVDEFQVFFAEDDKLAQDAAVLLEQLVRQGRAFGIHVVLGSQTLGGVFGLARSTIGQMAVRIALQCSEADSQLILDENNVAARLLSRPGEAIYNDAGGAFAGNSPFQTAWLSESCRDACLSRITERARAKPSSHEPMVVFEGNVPADIRENRLLAQCLESSQIGWASAHAGSPPSDVTEQHGLKPILPSTLRVWLGAPVTMKDPTAVTLRRQSGANVLMVGQRDETAMNLTAAALVGLAAQLPPERGRFVILDGSPADAPQGGTLARVAQALPHSCRLVAWREVPETIAELAQEVEKRMQENQHDAPPVFLIVYGLQRYRVLRRGEDGLGLSFEEKATPQPDRQFAELLREGPGVGVHVLTWADTLSTLERTLERQALREFDHRVLFQMSAADSSNLIDSPSANQLGLHRALLYSEEQGGCEKFRPYGPLPADWLAQVHQRLTG